MTTRTVEANFSHVGGDGTFQGYASVFDIEDANGSAIKKGAFDDTLLDRAPNDIKLLYQHDTERVIGTILELRSDAVGLFIRAQLALGTPDGKLVYDLMRTGAIDGLSIGFRSVSEKKVDGLLIFLEVDLIEISVVTFQSNPEATVDSIQLYDTADIVLDGTRTTLDGYLTAFARVARVGVQVYKGKELGRPDLDKVRVYRSPEEVFSRDSLRSFANRPVTNDHPPERVNASNWRKYSRGQTGEDVLRDGEFVRVPLVLMDAEAIADYRAGKKQLSMGYDTELQWGKGLTTDGIEYDAVQTKIRANHLATVPVARGGPDLRIGDSNEGEDAMNDKRMVQLTLDGIPIEVGDLASTVIQKSIAGMEKQIENLKAKIKEEEEKEKKRDTKDAETITAHKTAIEAKDAEIVTLKKQLADAELKPEALDKMVKDRAAVVESARAVLGDKLVVDGKSDVDIKRQVVDAVLGDDAKNWTPEQIAASFAIATKKVGGSFQQTDRLADAFSRQSLSNPVAARDAAYAEYDKAIEQKWRTPTAA